MAFGLGAGGAGLQQLLAARQQQQPQQPQQVQAPPVIDTGPDRSQIIAQLLQQRGPQRQANPQSFGELGARLGSRLIDAFSDRSEADKQIDAREEQQRAKVEALVATGMDPNTATLMVSDPNLGGQVLAQRGRVEAGKVKAQQEAAVQQQKATAAAAKAKGERFDDVQSLRKEATSITKNFREQKTALERIRSVSFDKKGNLIQTPAASLALVFNFMKILDPTSVVRESEFRTAAQARAAFGRMEEGGISIPSPLLAALQQIEGTGSLLPEQIRDFNTQGESIVAGAKITTLDDISPILQAATAQKFETNRIFSKSILDDLKGDVPEPAAQGMGPEKINTLTPEQKRIRDEIFKNG